MVVFLIITCVLVMQQAATAQGTVLLLKKKGKTVERFYPGKDISFITTEDAKVSANLQRFTADSLFLLFYDARMVGTFLGTAKKDTLGVYPIAFSVQNIGSFPRMPKARLLTGAMMLGGSAYTVVNIVNTTREGDPPFGKDNLPNVLAGIGTAVAGFLINRLQPRSYPLGNTYTLQVVQ
jgi:hypothetical protein